MEKRIKIANIIEEGRLGGPQIRIAEVARRLKQYHCETVVICPSTDSNAFVQKLEKYGIEKCLMPLHRLSRRWQDLSKYILCFPYEVLSVYRVLRKGKFDVLHVSGGSWQYKGVIAGRLAGCKVLWHLNDTDMPRYVKLLFKVISTYCANGFIVAGQRVKNYYVDQLKLGKKKPIFEIQAPVDCSVFEPHKIEKDNKISEYSGVHIVSVGNINPCKGFEYFIQMASQLNKKYSNLVFWIVGPGLTSQKNYLEGLKMLIEEYQLKNCHFYGASDNVAGILKSADIYVCASVTEASPISVWEAMSMEKAIVSTDVGDVPRFINNGVNGYIVSAGNPHELSDKVGLLLKDDDKRNVFGLNARQTVLGHLDINICTQNHKKAYTQIMGL